MATRARSAARSWDRRARPHEPKAGTDHHSAGEQKTDVPPHPGSARRCLVDVVDAQKDVVDQAFDDIEHAPTAQHRAGKLHAGPGKTMILSRPPEQKDARDDQHIRETMEDPIPQRVMRRLAMLSTGYQLLSIWCH